MQFQYCSKSVTLNLSKLRIIKTCKYSDINKTILKEGITKHTGKIWDFDLSCLLPCLLLSYLILSCLFLSCLIIDDIESDILIFADDTSLFAHGPDPAVTAAQLNHDLVKISEWATKWKITFNPGKSKDLIFSNKYLIE